MAYVLGTCPHFSVEKYDFSVDAVQPEMFANAEHDAPESFRDTKLAPLRQSTISVISLLVQFSMIMSDTLRRKIRSKRSPKQSPKVA
jgi:hypothetical protein